MADDSNFRSYRPRDPRAPDRGTAASTGGGRQGANDPLAELARLIGQTDPFADLNRKAGGHAAVPRMPRASEFDTPVRPVPPAASYDRHQPSIAARHLGPAPFDQSSLEPEAGFEPAYDPAIFGSAPQNAGHPQQPYYPDPSAMPQGEEHYEDDYMEPRPRRGMKTIALVAALAIVGAGAAFGYRALFGTRDAGTPPVIKADSSPSKVVPPSKKEASNKLIYDRVGDSSQGEKIVSREEQPMSVPNAQAANSGPSLPGMANSPDGAGPASPPLAAMPAGPDIAEPKKVRTVAIRPDQPLSASVSTPANMTPQPAPDRPPAPAPVAAPRSLAPAAAVEPAAAPQPRNAPLSLVPQSIDQAPAASARPAASPAASAQPGAPTQLASVNPVAAAGTYAVQISSQRSEAEAQSSFRSLQAKYPSVLGGQQPIIRRADLGSKGIYYRAMVGPFASLDQATEVCRNLKAAGGQCVVQRN
ncbi:MAG TPA: SPOR domain-containing protein [Xanthobacteraceae bacterium]|nr:SPOR domain-containing protein [Xanthobacteraceae bacterium]